MVCFQSLGGQKKSCPAGANLPLWTNGLPPLKFHLPLSKEILVTPLSEWLARLLTWYLSKEKFIFLTQIIFVYKKSLKRMFKPDFWVQNHLLNLFSRVVNSQRLFCSQKAAACEMFVLKLSGQQMIMMTHNRTLIFNHFWYKINNY